MSAPPTAAARSWPSGSFDAKQTVATTRAPPEATPATAPHRQVIEALREVGIDASDHIPHRLDDEVIQWADVVVATCDDACPVIPGKHYIAWQLPDPKHEPIERVREIRDDINRRVHELVAALDEKAA